MDEELSIMTYNKSISFYKKNAQKYNNTLHIETDLGIINIRVGLSNFEGKQVTSIEVIPDQNTKLEGYSNTRLIEKVKSK